MVAFGAGIEALLDQALEHRLGTRRTFDPQAVGDLLGIFGRSGAAKAIKNHAREAGAFVAISSKEFWSDAGWHAALPAIQILQLISSD